ncbi:MAG: ribosome silencing factor [Armatimonadetes bacterium]|nr:ribosome silencing factor [Armatimonadota bacterium]
MPERDARTRAVRCAEAASSKQAEDIVVLDLQALTLVTDYFVICTGTSSVQIRAIVEAVEEAMAGDRVHPLAREGDAQSGWVLLDFGSLVVHIFTPQTRTFYKLERLWGDAEPLAWAQE